MPTTGLRSADAQDDFQRARRRATLARVAATLRREPQDVDVILPFDEVVAALGRVGEVQAGLEIIALDSVVGTVSRGARDFDRQFRPVSGRVRPRWERIALARRRGEPMPPIDVYRLGEAHFVRDGHHRVSVARAQGEQTIDARVTEVLTKVGIDRSLRITDLPMKSHERLFAERVPLDAGARARIRLTDPWRYGMLAEGVEAWGFRLMQRDTVALGRPEIAGRWFREEYEPVVSLLLDAELFDPRRELEGDAYLRLTAERYWIMRSQEWSEEAVARLRRR